MPNNDRHTAIRVLLADDHDLVRFGLRAVLEFEPDIRVVGEAANGEEALELILRLRPDVVLADVSMPPPDALALAARLKIEAPEVRVIALTMHEDAELAREALKAGAACYVIKRSSPAELYQAVRLTAAGQSFVSDGLR